MLRKALWDRCDGKGFSSPEQQLSVHCGKQPYKKRQLLSQTCFIYLVRAKVKRTDR